MFSDRPGTPGRRQQMLRTTRSTCTPACDASYSDSITGRSTRPFIFSTIRPAAPGRRVRGHAAHLVDDALAQVGRRHEQLAVALRAAEAGQVVEEVGDVGGDVRPAREEAGVGVEARGARVVVAGADVHVAADAAVLAAHHERALGVRLERREAVHDVHAGALQRARPADVARLVEARLELDQHHGLLALLGRADQRRHHRRVARRAVDRVLDREHVGVVDGLLDEALDRRREARRRGG